MHIKILAAAMCNASKIVDRLFDAVANNIKKSNDL